MPRRGPPKPNKKRGPPKPNPKRKAKIRAPEGAWSTAIAQYDYEPCEDNEIALTEGETYWVFEFDEEAWSTLSSFDDPDNQLTAPSNYLELQDPGEEYIFPGLDDEDDLCEGEDCEGDLEEDEGCDYEDDYEEEEEEEEQYVEEPIHYKEPDQVQREIHTFVPPPFPTDGPSMMQMQERKPRRKRQGEQQEMTNVPPPPPGYF
eukprot:gnl/Dysnectes_brevis/2478_a2961_2257.p1 GENE.gnl/Dysnectes_brevis/2478_a2961_2257~~gnl/Dysnectes_brevis/2478_a2961_2257.p1  ORF type:complete len:203 (-),score=66.58 gnl/Dysnectes_brevis/2478_a2961_2257:103-711(-)